MTIYAVKLPNRRLVNPDTVASPVFVLADRHRRFSGPWHAHRRLQLLHVSDGVLFVETRVARVVIPPQRAVWIPAGTEHRIASRAPFWLTTCYIDANCFPETKGNVVAVDRLTDAVLIAVSAFGENGPQNAPQRRLVAVLLDCLRGLKSADIVLPQPSDPRLRRIAERLIEDPSASVSLPLLAAEVALSERTAARLFKKETGQSFGIWRSHLRMQAALEQLSAGLSVTEAAFAVGYQDVSSFIEAFKKLFGQTPSQILKGSEGSLR